MNATKLSPKQQRFVDEYLIDLNATQAAIRAGYSNNNGWLGRI
ncbi:MAG: terminase small subunit [Rhodospirillales bacterium]|jgi:phage terminase small subunit|nr:terminase small subunit [Rhodospirillales bacterium]